MKNRRQKQRRCEKNHRDSDDLNAQATFDQVGNSHITAGENHRIWRRGYMRAETVSDTTVEVALTDGQHE